MIGPDRLGLRSRNALLVAGAVWLGAIAGRWWAWWGVLVVTAIGASLFRVIRQHPTPIVAVLVLVGGVAGQLSVLREQAILEFVSPAGRIQEVMRLVTDPRQEDHGWWALAVADPPEAQRPVSIPMLLSFTDPPTAIAGETLFIEGRRTTRSGTARGDPYSGVVTVGVARALPASQAPWWEAGNSIRRRTMERLSERGPSRALLAGFLIGETADVPDADLEAMRRSGISHLVAVSGSNVALFLMLALLAAGPLASGPRRRAVVGLGAIVVLAVATRWEPSVVRASVMAGLVLGGRVGGWALDAASALAVTVVAVVVVSGELATDVGFALSVLATLGVIVGGRIDTVALPRAVAATLGATIGAQLAVAPVLLIVFGSVPLMAPITNLVAAPVVAASTLVGAIGVALGWDFIIDIAAAGASIVLSVARVGAGWPQLGWIGSLVAVAIVGLWAVRGWRPLAVGLGALAVAIALVGTSGRPPMPGAVFLDVGQGDSILMVAEDGSALLVDGGPDPAVLEAKLAGWGIRALDLVVLTHVHADHATGLAAVVGRRPVREMWVPGPPHQTPASRRLVGEAAAAGVPMREPPVGERVVLGDLAIEVLGPLRRYASPNDQSIVLRVTGPTGRTLLLTGDIETFAQADLRGVAADILKVPHQGGATSNLEWLEEVDAGLAIISVGPNDFGHPSDEVIAALEASGAEVRRTDIDGDIVVPLD